MFAEVTTGMTIGIQGELITVQADISDGLPVFYMIGYLSSEVKEAKERVKTALKNSGFFLPAKRIAVNLAPADLRKSGSNYDLAIAVSLMIALGLLSSDQIERTLFLGELALDGTITGIPGVLPIIKCARESGFERCVVPLCNAREAALIDDMEVYAFSNLAKVFEYLRTGLSDHIYVERLDEFTDEGAGNAHPVEAGNQVSDQIPDIPDFSEIKGQPLAKKALKIAVAGYHNLFLDGPPGVGKSMLASSIPGIMPDMTKEEQIDITMIHSVKGLLSHHSDLLTVRPFRAPSHAVTMAGMFGGGTHPKPGEISLAHHGVLFLDEFPEYKRDLIDMFRIPLENHQINLVRYEKNITFPADFILVVAANPCPCGYYPDRNLCRCTQPQIQAYHRKISGPVMDRIDLYVRCNKVAFQELNPNKNKTVAAESSNFYLETSEEVKRQIADAWEIQRQRFGKNAFNGRMNTSQVNQYCQLDSESRVLMEQVYEQMHLTGRAYHKVLKVARTIADLEHCESIQRRHLEEALLFRKQWGSRM